ncbi:MAG TPA: hypothetical protein VE093_40920 [Polyangiaceae bacterium]|nr:hypothetical protein [Polyangiaceae bacterium]
MIGGDDIFVEGCAGIGVIDIVLRFMRHAWRDAIFECTAAEGSEPVQITRLFPAKETVELFVYRDRSSFESWKRDGLTEENASGIIYVVFNEGAISFVVDERESPSGRLVQELATTIRANRMVLGG